MPSVSPFLVAAATVAALMLTMWVVSVIAHDVSIVDIAWGAGFVLVAWTTAIASGTWSAVTVILVGTTTVWGLRLAGYLAWRNLGHGEDRRYVRMRERRGDAFRWQSLYVVFGLQGALMWVVSLPQQATADTAAGATAVTWIGVALWGVGVTWESVADAQLARFKSDPANSGVVLDAGLWRLSRHPNYFGDAVAWWGFFVVAASAGGWWTILSPIVMTFLLLRVSGVALLDRDLRQTKPTYADYVASTNAFIPGPKKA